MLKEPLTRQYEEQRSQDVLGEQRSEARRFHEQRRLEDAQLFEQALDGLFAFSKIRGWHPANPQELRQHAIHYWVGTEGGPIPFSVSATHRKAQLKRKKHPELEHTIVTMRYAPTGTIKPLSKIRKQILEGISNVLEQDGENQVPTDSD